MSTDRKTRLRQLNELIHKIRGEPQAQPAADLPSPERAENGQSFLIVGLGNPGPKYAGNRHNVGFMLLDRLADELGVQFSRAQHQAVVTDARHAGHKLILAKPQTYMNESGRSVAALIKFYKIPLENLLIVFDEMDIPMGSIRIRKKGGSGGHNGMKSIIRQLGNRQEFPRIRIGISRPPGRMPPPSYLLQDFSYDQQSELGPILDRTVESVFTYVTDGIDRAMNQYNGPAVSAI